MKTTTQYRVTFNTGATRWFDSLEEATESAWLLEEGGMIITRQLVQEDSFSEHMVIKRQGARIVTASRHEIAAMMKQAMNDGKAFAAQNVGPCTYKVMEIA